MDKVTRGIGLTLRNVELPIVLPLCPNQSFWEPVLCKIDKVQVSWSVVSLLKKLTRPRKSQPETDHLRQQCCDVVHAPVVQERFCEWRRNVKGTLIVRVEDRTECCATEREGC